MEDRSKERKKGETKGRSRGIEKFKISLPASKSGKISGDQRLNSKQKSSVSEAFPASITPFPDDGCLEGLKTFDFCNELSRLISRED
jgi:hypothetical protein